MFGKIFNLKVYSIDADKARDNLKVVDDSLAFRVNEGELIHSLEELAQSLGQMEKVDYLYHANIERNDFATWVYDVLGDEWLAKKLRRTESQTKVAELVSQHLDYLRKVVQG